MPRGGKLVLRAIASLEKHVRATYSLPGASASARGAVLKTALLGVRSSGDERVIYAGAPGTVEQQQDERPEHNFNFADRDTFSHHLDSSTVTATGEGVNRDFAVLVAAPRRRRTLLPLCFAAASTLLARFAWPRRALMDQRGLVDSLARSRGLRLQGAWA